MLIMPFSVPGLMGPPTVTRRLSLCAATDANPTIAVSWRFAYLETKTMIEHNQFAQMFMFRRSTPILFVVSTLISMSMSTGNH